MTAPDPAASILTRLSAVPDGVDVSLVIRHAQREEIPAGTFGHDVNLTADGTRAAEKLGAALSEKRTICAVSSPVPRCIQTAQAMLRGTGLPSEIHTDPRLGGPGAFVIDPGTAGQLFQELPIPEIARRQLQDAASLPGMRPTSEGIEVLMDLVTSPLGKEGRLHVFVTHDIILSVFAASILRSSLEEIGWPDYLEGLLVWRSAGRFHFIWQGKNGYMSQPTG